MYQVYIKEKGFGSKKLIGEYKDYDDATGKIETELAKDNELKYVIEETTGHIDSYGELLTIIIDEN